MTTPAQMNLDAAMDLADHASPAPWSASLALKAMRAEILRLRARKSEVSEEDATRLDEYLHGEFDICIGKQATHAALTDVWHNRPAQDRHPDDIAVDAFAESMKAKLAEARQKGRSGWQDKIDCPQQRLSNMLRNHVKKGDPLDVANFCMFLFQRGESILPRTRTMIELADDLLPKQLAQEKAEPLEMSPEFTDAARGAIAWVLYHHQGGSSPVGQPLRFALGMGAHERLSADRIAEAKRYAAWAGATTEQFYRPPAERVRMPDGMTIVPKKFVETVRAAGRDGTHPRAVPILIEEALEMLSAAPEASSHGG